MKNVMKQPTPNGRDEIDAFRIPLEKALRDRVLAGDSAAWACLYERCFDSLFAYLSLRAGPGTEGVEDVVQECWMTAARRIRSFDPDRGSFLRWMQGIGNNVLRNDRRRWRRRESRERSSIEEMGETIPIRQNPAACTGLEFAEQIALALSTLPTPYREVLRAKYQDELSMAEIARRSGGTVKSVESLLSRARGAFRKAYRSVDDG